MVREDGLGWVDWRSREPVTVEAVAGFFRFMGLFRGEIIKTVTAGSGFGALFSRLKSIAFNNKNRFPRGGVGVPRK